MPNHVRTLAAAAAVPSPLWVVKIGTAALAEGGDAGSREAPLCEAALRALAGHLARWRSAGTRVVLVSSGAVACGRAAAGTASAGAAASVRALAALGQPALILPSVVTTSVPLNR